MTRTRPAQLAAILGIIAGTIVGVWHLQLPTGVVGEVRVQDDDRAERILEKLDKDIADERATHHAPELGYTLDPAAFLVRTTEMYRLDQLVRTWEPPGRLPPEIRRRVWSGIAKRMVEIDAKHTRELKRWVRRNEWPTLSVYGKRAMMNAWLLAQHADQDRAFQKVVLRQMIERARQGEIEKWQPAYLWDRVAVGEKRLQIFATQGRCVARNAWEAWPFVDPPKLDRRRAKVGLEPYAQYRKRASKMCKNFRR